MFCLACSIGLTSCTLLLAALLLHFFFSVFAVVGCGGGGVVISVLLHLPVAQVNYWNILKKEVSLTEAPIYVLIYIESIDNKKN